MQQQKRYNVFFNNQVFAHLSFNVFAVQGSQYTGLHKPKPRSAFSGYFYLSHCSLVDAAVSEPQANERSSSLSDKKELHYRDIQSLLLPEPQFHASLLRILNLSFAHSHNSLRVYCASQIFHSRIITILFVLCWSGRFRMRSGLPRAFFLH